MKDVDRRRRAVLSGKVKWGPWVFRKSNLTIEHNDGYYIDLDRCTDSAHFLDSIAQVSGKKLRYTAE